MFQLTREEIELVKSQIATSRNETLFEGKKRVPKYFLRLLEYYVRMEQMNKEEQKFETNK